ncbi:MAG: tetratricopeptide repeat protein, partial [Sulfuritalea sp.]|nr:tetratricopeptide repeat protein [Sulfuritalea sp.]
MSEQEVLHLLVEQTFQRALALHQTGQLKEAGELYRDILQSYPDHAEANHNMGVLAVQLKMPAAGLPYFTAALNVDPVRAQYWLSYIDALHQSDQKDEALEVLALARRQGLEGVEVEMLAAYLADDGLAADRSNLEQQEITNDSPCESVPGDINGLCPDPKELNSLVALFGQGRITEAADLARTITEHSPRYGPGWKMLGVMLKQLGRNEDALVPMQQAAVLSPGDAEAHNLLGITLSDLGKAKEAEASYRRSLQINPNDPQVHSNLGATLQFQGLLEEAETSYRRALEIKPDYAKGHCNLGAVLDSLDRIEEAEVCYRRALEIDPERVEAHSNLGNVLKKLGRYEEARASYQEAHQLGSSGADVRAALMLPAIMGTRQEIIESRAKFEQQLDELIAVKLTIDDPLESVGEANFYLAYHGLNDRDLQIKIAKFYEQACPSLLLVAPHCLRSRTNDRKRVQVGFFSKFLFSHSVSLCFSKVIETLS